MVKDALQECEQRMKGAVEALEAELLGIRTGRASPALVERLLVDYYGTPTQLQQLATISAPEPQLLTIRPYDPSTIKEIERAIRASQLGLNPSNDGKIIRLVIPPLTEERRLELVKLVHRKVEEAKVAVRNCRRDTLEDLRNFKEEGLISEDEFFRGRDDLQELTDRYIEKVEAVGKRKEDEIRQV
uniref:Ribosome recycling factor n=1 Tax=uncultured prokaryote TaxID=198431 RepID=H5SIS4_9ZZZZ|nr:ribosome recycling factor [uncultured prokaryote]